MVCLPGPPPLAKRSPWGRIVTLRQGVAVRSRIVGHGRSEPPGLGRRQEGGGDLIGHREVRQFGDHRLAALEPRMDQLTRLRIGRDQPRPVGRGVGEGAARGVDVRPVRLLRRGGGGLSHARIKKLKDPSGRFDHRGNILGDGRVYRYRSFVGVMRKPRVEATNAFKAFEGCFPLFG